MTTGAHVPQADPRVLRTVAGVVTTFVVALAFAVVLGMALVPLSNSSGATPFDSHITMWFVSRRSDGWTTVMRALTTLGGTAVIASLTIPLVIALCLIHRVRLAVFMGIAAAGASLLSAVAKAVVGRERPPEPLHLAHVVTASFPSGHATQAAATYLAVAVVATYCLRRNWIVAVWSAAVVVAAAVGVSRVYLGVHWATDVLGGWLLGALWVGGLVVSFEPMRHRALHGEVVSARRSSM